MAMTLEQLKQQLSDIEPSESTYEGVGAAEIPLLDQLLQDPDHLVASRAVFALSRVRDARSLALLQRAAADTRPQVRVAVAASSVQIPVADRSRVLLPLLNDTEVGVRKFAIHSADALTDATVLSRLRQIESSDPMPALRTLATDKIKNVR